jgi:hypothetical protein
MGGYIDVASNPADRLRRRTAAGERRTESTA